MAFCESKTQCGSVCARQEMHGGDCLCREQKCGVCLRAADPHAWIQTYTGRAFYPLDPDPCAVNVIDIAHALSNMCRFTGHTREFYSVAQHSVLVARVLPQYLKLEGLFHDASEGYLIDFPRPVKYHKSFSFYREAEQYVDRAIRTALGLSYREPDAVKTADKRMLTTERRDLMTSCPVGHEWQETQEPFKFKITPWSPKLAKSRFLECAKKLLLAAGPSVSTLPAWDSLGKV